MVRDRLVSVEKRQPVDRKMQKVADDFTAHFFFFFI